MALRLTSDAPSGLASSPVERLSDRELEIFQLLGQGRTPSEIARDLNLSLKTFKLIVLERKKNSVSRR